MVKNQTNGIENAGPICYVIKWCFSLSMPQKHGKQGFRSPLAAGGFGGLVFRAGKARTADADAVGGRFFEVELHLVGHSALQRFAQPVIAQHAPFGMFQGKGLGSLWQIKPDFSHFVLFLHDAERGGEGKVGWCHHLDQGAGFIVQVTHIVDKGAHIVRQLAETSHRKLLCPKGRRNG